MSNCRSCGAEIEWIELKSGKKMPVDLPALTEGTGTLVKVWPDGVAEVITNLGDLDEDCTYYRSHFSSCPDSDDWRSRKESEGKRFIKEKVAAKGRFEW